MPDILTKEQWDAEWAKIDPLTIGKSMPLYAYSELCDQVKDSWSIPHRFSSNGRYEVYIDGLLSEGVDVPDEIIKDVDSDANRFGDVPLVGKRIQEYEQSFGYWIDLFIKEKGFDVEHTFEVEGPEWGTNYIPLGSLVEAMKGASFIEQKHIKETFIQIDLTNPSKVFGYFEHLAKALAL